MADLPWRDHEAEWQSERVRDEERRAAGARAAQRASDVQIIEAAEELAKAADRAASPKDFPMLSADQLMRLCALARAGLRPAICTQRETP